MALEWLRVAPFLPVSFIGLISSNTFTAIPYNLYSLLVLFMFRLVSWWRLGILLDSSLPYFFKIYFNCLCVHTHVHSRSVLLSPSPSLNLSPMYSCTHESRYLQRPELYLPLKLALQAHLSHLMWLLGSRIGSSARIIHAFNYWAISPAPLPCVWSSLKDSHWNVAHINLTRMTANGLQGSTSPHSCTGVQLHMCRHAWLICLFYFSMGDGSANSGSHAHTADILPTQSSSAPQNLFLTFLKHRAFLI